MVNYLNSLGRCFNLFKFLDDISFVDGNEIELPMGTV